MLQRRERPTRQLDIAATGQTRAASSVNNFMDHLTIYGWRKKCLFSLLFVLAILVSLNLALTLWILKVMEFSSDGMGNLKMVPGGIKLNGQAMVMDTLRASKISSRSEQPLVFESYRNFTINTRNDDGFVENRLFLGHDRLEVNTKQFKVTDQNGMSLFSVDKDAVAIGAQNLRAEGDGGIIIKDSIQTRLIRSEAGKDLRIESPTRSLEMHAAQGVFVQSRAGNIDINSLNDLKLYSTSGSIRLDAPIINIPNLKLAQPHTQSYYPSLSSSSNQQVFQLCVCGNGKLFLAPPNSICASDSEVCR